MKMRAFRRNLKTLGPPCVKIIVLYTEGLLC